MQIIDNDGPLMRAPTRKMSDIITPEQQKGLFDAGYIVVAGNSIHTVTAALSIDRSVKLRTPKEVLEGEIDSNLRRQLAAAVPVAAIKRKKVVDRGENGKLDVHTAIVAFMVPNSERGEEK